MQANSKRPVNRSRTARKRGAAAVEFAVVLPILLIMLFGIIEFGRIFTVRLSAQEAAREGCRLAVLQSTEDPTSADGPVVTRITNIMESAGLPFSYTIVPNTPGDPTVTVTVTVPYGEVSLTGLLNLAVEDIVGQCSMRKEG